MELFLLQLAWLARFRELGLAANEKHTPERDEQWRYVWQVYSLLGSPCLPRGHGKVWGYQHRRKP